MRSKAIICTATALVLLVSGSFAQAQSSSTSTGSGSSSSSSFSSSTGTSTSQGAQQQGTAAFPQQQQAPAPVALPSETRQLQQPFHTVALCAPINLRIVPNTTAPTPQDAYTFTVTAEQNILSMIQAEVAPEGTLSITATGPFETNQTVQLTVSLPPDALNSIVHSGPNAAIYVAPGFNVTTATSALNVTTNFGAGELYIQEFVAQKLSIVHHGIGNLVVQGNFGEVTATSDAIAPLYISGVQNSAQLTLFSTADAFIGQQPTSTITGTAAGLNRVTYTAGSCQIASPFSTLPNLALQTCSQQAFLLIPPAQPQWTCGIQIQGNFTCRAATVLSLGPQGTSVSQPGTPTITSTSPGGFFSSGPTAQGGGTQVQAGQAQPGSASALAGVAGTGSVSSSAVSTSGPGGSTSTTQTSQGGQTQGFTTSSGGQTQSFGSGGTSGSPGVLVSYEGTNGETASAASVTCAAPLDATRMLLSV